ncbi:hypothetical protein ACHWQZ_G010884 [Mnemiopsis leidyi]
MTHHIRSHKDTCGGFIKESYTCRLTPHTTSNKDSKRTLLRRPYKRFGVHKTLDSYSSDLQRRKTKF